MRFIWSVASIVLAAAGLLESVSPASAGTLFQPHRALYDIKLARSDSRAEIADVKGRMSFEWRGGCEGWTVEQRYIMRYFTAAGTVSEIITSYATWESLDGRDYRFRIRKNRDGEIEELNGTARLDEAGGAATYDEPSETEFELSAGTLFPSGHTFALIDHARAGKRFFGARIFDGGEIEPDVVVTAAIGRLSKPGKPGKHAALNGDYWPVRLAFFPIDEAAGEPEYEMDLALHANGIVRSLVLDYGDFAVGMEIGHFEPLGDPVDREKC